jgi:hypothetical protein
MFGTLKVFVVGVWLPASGGEVENICRLLNQQWAKWLPADHSVAV